MKILHIIPNLRKGGAERLVVDIVREFSKRKGLDIKLILFENIIEYDVNDIINYIQVIPSNINISIFKRNKFNVKALQQTINQFDPEIIHSHLFESEIISRSCIYNNAKWFSHCHDKMPNYDNFKLKTFFNKRLFTNFIEKVYLFKSYKKNGGTNFIAISNDTKLHFEKKAKPFKVHLLYNAIDLSVFQPSQTNKKLNLKLISVGALNNNKNHSFLIDVMALLDNKSIQFNLTILGEGPKRSYLENKIKDYNLQDKIFLLGAVKNVEEYLKASTMYIHSAKSEALGLTIIEAMATGLPVITLDGKGNRDLIEQGKNGYMIFEHDVEKFANQIVNLWNNQYIYREMSNYSQQFALKFDIKNYASRLLEIYYL